MRSKVIVIIIAFVTVILGAAAVWIGLRLSQEKAVTPMGTEAWVTGPGNVCISASDWMYDHCDLDITFAGYHEDVGDGENIRICAQATNNGGYNNSLDYTEFTICYCPDRGVEPYCNPDNCCNPSVWGCHDNCQTVQMSGSVDPGETFTHCRQIPKVAECGIAQLDFGGVPVVSCDHGGDVGWGYSFGDECPMTCESLTATPTTVNAGETISLVTTVDDPYSAVTNYDYGTDLSGSSISDGSATTSWLIPSGTAAGTYHAWVMAEGGPVAGTTMTVGDAGCSGFGNCTSGSNGCDVEIVVEGGTGGGLSCDSLVASPSLSSLTEDDFRTGDMDIDLTTTATANDITIGSSGYDYGTDITGASFSSDPDGPSTQITIPQGTTSGTYHIWVEVTGTDGSDTYQSGCSSATNCDVLGEGCLLTFPIGEGTCDCESVSRSPSDSTLAAGSYVSYIMTVSDADGTPCEVSATDVTWGITGSPVLDETERSPMSGSAVQHNIVYQVSNSASGDTQYCVSAEVAGNGVVDACQNCFTVGGMEQAAFVAEKTSSIVCINNDTAARITYNINVRNVSGVGGVIEYVQDTYDSRFQSSWVSSISPTPDSHSGNIIRWDNNDTGYALAANDGVSGGDDEMIFSYVVTVPASYFGSEYRNQAIVKPQDQESINLETSVMINCVQGLPPTGILDDALKVIIIAYLFLLLGSIWLRFYGIRAIKTFTKGIEVNLKNSSKKSFEKRVVDRVERDCK